MEKRCGAAVRIEASSLSQPSDSFAHGPVAASRGVVWRDELEGD
jgi:hypothetical protein